MTHLYLIRHAEAVSNVVPIVGGMRGDMGLTPRGMAQAERLRDRLSASGEISASVLIASTLPRARRTAEIVAPALGLPIIWDDDVQELRPGAADGMPESEFIARYGKPDFEHDPYRPIAPDGESWAQFMLRVAGMLHRMAREHSGKNVVIVTHGGVIDGSFITFFGISQLAQRQVRFYTLNTSLTHWERIAEENQPVRWRLVAYNDAAHLDGALRDSGPLTTLRPEEHSAAPVATEEPTEP